jgi:predicted Zn-dependent peptidase
MFYFAVTEVPLGQRRIIASIMGTRWELRMRCSTIAAAAMLLSACATVPQDAARDPVASAPTPTLPAFAIPYQETRLPNGLRLIVHEDRKAPIVAVNVWYHVGSKDEPPGKTGFAHLFEHLMFNGSENWRDEYFKPFERVGATEINGTTWLDRTNYFENVPTTALDMALWMESDRMGHLVGAIDQKTLDEQRGVVQNEKRQGDNQPYGRSWEWLQRASFPEGHPYRWETIGSMDDLNAASLADVKEWFANYYGAANVTLVLAGDIDMATARAKVERYFGDIPAGPPVSRREVWIAPRSSSTRDLMQDRVAQTRIMRSWNVPPFGSDAAQQLAIAADVLGGGKTSRLYKRLVYDEKLASSVSASVEAFEIAGLFVIQADLQPGADAARVEAIVDEETQRLIAEGPRADELQRAKIGYASGLIRGAERIGGFSGKSSLLAECAVFTGDPGCTAKGLATVERATATDVQSAARTWLAQGDYTLTIEPYPQYKTVAGGVDRSHGPPQVEQFPSLNFPVIERGRLSNGIPVVLAERHSVPVVDVQMLFDAGYAADQGGKLGASSFAMSMLDEGTERMDSLEIARRRESLGAQIAAGSTLDTSTVALSALKSTLPESLDLYADVIRRPAFRDADIARLRGQWLSAIEQEKTAPVSLALRVLPPLLYGPEHPYAIPFTGSGTEASIRSLTRDDLVRFHEQWIAPDRAAILVTGDTTLGEILPMLEQRFANWQSPGGTRPAKAVTTVPPPPTPRVYLMDRPGSQQSVIIAGRVSVPGTTPNWLPIETMNAAFGGTFTSRLNMNLREEKHWAYGAGSLMFDAIGPQPWLMYAPVQTDKTAEAIAEMQREVRDYVGRSPVTAAEIQKIKDERVRSLPGRFETGDAVMGALVDIVVFHRPDDEVQTLKARIEALSLDEVRSAARQVIDPTGLTWLVVGDLERIEPGIRKLGLGEIVVLDADGQPRR